jgi:hypothetical protein
MPMMVLRSSVRETGYEFNFMRFSADTYTTNLDTEDFEQFTTTTYDNITYQDSFEFENSDAMWDMEKLNDVELTDVVSDIWNMEDEPDYEFNFMRFSADTYTTNLDTEDFEQFTTTTYTTNSYEWDMEA